MLEIVKENLIKRLNRVPQWYWDRRPGSKEFIQTAIDNNDLTAAEDSIYFIEYKLEDWASD